MTKTLLATAALSLLMTMAASAEEKSFTATLKGHAILPANTIIVAPSDAPEYLKTSGKFTTADRKRAEALGTVPGKDGVRLTGLSLPFDGQPMQGFSGIKAMEDGTFWSLSDNGFGSKMNSSDAMLMLHHVKMDWDAGKVEALKTLFLTDPDKKAPFRSSWKARTSVISPAPTSTSNRSSRLRTASGSVKSSAPTSSSSISTAS